MIVILCWGEVKATVGRIVQMRRGGSEAKPSTLTSASADPHVPLENSIATGRSAAEPRSPLSLVAPLLIHGQDAGLFVNAATAAIAQVNRGLRLGTSVTSAD